MPVLDLAANYDELGKFVTGRIAPEFANYGLELHQLLVENMSLPPEVEQALDRRTSMGVVGDLRSTPSSRPPRRCGRRPEPGRRCRRRDRHGHGLRDGEADGRGDCPEAAAPPAATPPPLPQEKAFYVAKAGQQAGPFPLAEVRAPDPGWRAQRYEPGVEPGHGRLDRCRAGRGAGVPVRCDAAAAAARPRLRMPLRGGPWGARSRARAADPAAPPEPDRQLTCEQCAAVLSYKPGTDTTSAPIAVIPTRSRSARSRSSSTISTRRCARGLAAAPIEETQTLKCPSCAAEFTFDPGQPRRRLPVLRPDHRRPDRRAPPDQAVGRAAVRDREGAARERVAGWLQRPVVRARTS